MFDKPDEVFDWIMNKVANLVYNEQASLWVEGKIPSLVYEKNSAIGSDFPYKKVITMCDEQQQRECGFQKFEGTIMKDNKNVLTIKGYAEWRHPSSYYTECTITFDESDKIINKAVKAWARMVGVIRKESEA